jgi:hypothetical protein
VKRELLSHNVPLVPFVSEGFGAGGVMGMYGFFALITPTKSEKLSRCVALRRLDMVVLLPVEPKLIGESKPDVETSVGDSARLMRSILASVKVSAW